MSRTRAVIIKELPQELTQKNAEGFFLDVATTLESDRPRVVFDFSNVDCIDSAGIAILLTCIEEALKRNGDIKLAALRPSTANVLEAMELDELFEIFETSSEAVDSFQRVPGYELPCIPETWTQDLSFASGDD